MALLPLMLFVRNALGPHGWRAPSAKAAFIFDDPNLRRPGYGYLNYRHLIKASERHGFHTALAMIPIDYRKTSPAVAEMFRRDAQFVSLVIHGVDHMRNEFGKAISEETAERLLSAGLGRMALHEASTGVHHARAMTFPHGVCNETWLSAMRNVGLDAAIASRASPFKTEEKIVDPLYELHPAEMTFLGFPVVNRFKAERQQEDLLFQAWLGKPLIVYTHHKFVRNGLDRLIEIADFLNRHVAPSWEDIGSILSANYQVRAHGRGIAVRVFANRVAFCRTRDEEIGLVIKPGNEFPQDEIAAVDGEIIDLEHIARVGLVGCNVHADEETVIRFGPARQRWAADVSGPSVVRRMRRLATEIRDQALPLMWGSTERGDRVT